MLTLTDGAAGGSSVELFPGRGALVTSFRVGGRELLYLDASTLHDLSKNVRGGIPILFPAPGKLDHDEWRQGGHRGSMKQHGFARNLAWTVEKTGVAPSPFATLSLASSDVTRAQYPWDFQATFTFVLRGPSLRVEQTIANTGGERMPFGIGFHPYFGVSDKAHARIDTRATRAFDNVTKTEVPFEGFELTAPELDIHLLDHGSTASALHLPDGSRIDVAGSSSFTHFVVWTLAGKDFVCLEPWTMPGNALNTGDRLLWLDPGASQTSWIELAFVASV